MDTCSLLVAGCRRNDAGGLSGTAEPKNALLSSGIPPDAEQRDSCRSMGMSVARVTRIRFILVFEAGLFVLVLEQGVTPDTYALQHVCHHLLELAYLPVLSQRFDLLHVGLVRRLQLAQQCVQGRDAGRRRETPLNFTPYKEITPYMSWYANSPPKVK